MSLSRRITDDGLPQPTFSESDVQDEPARSPEVMYCDACGDRIQGKPAGSGLFLWTRGDEVRFEEPPLCSKCAPAIAFGATFEDDIVDE